MITISKYAFIAVSAVAVFTGSGCSSNISKPTQANHAVRKASFQKASYNSQLQDQNRLKSRRWMKISTLGIGFLEVSSSAADATPASATLCPPVWRNPDQLSLLSDRASVFMHMIVHELDRRDMPTELPCYRLSKVHLTRCIFPRRSRRSVAVHPSTGTDMV